MADRHPDTDPRVLLRELQDAAGEPPLVPLSLGTPPSSLRPGVAGRLVTRVRRGLIRIIAPSLLDLVGQLEHDRHAADRRLRDLETRVASLESARSDPPE